MLEFKLTTEGSQQIQMPAGSEIVGIGEIDGEIRVWARGNRENTKEPITIQIIEGGKYIGTINNRHIFEM